jgi:hypothetical protein
MLVDVLLGCKLGAVVVQLRVGRAFGVWVVVQL